MIIHTFEIVSVYDSVTEASLETEERSEEVTVATPDIAGHVKNEQSRIARGKLSYGETRKEIAIQA